MHILDTMLSERVIIAQNDKAVEDEEAEEEAAIHGERVTLDNVFDLAKQEEGDADSADNESEEND